jgi:hypothetical protein
MAPTMMIAEMGADLVKADSASSAPARRRRAGSSPS